MVYLPFYYLKKKKKKKKKNANINNDMFFAKTSCS